MESACDMAACLGAVLFPREVATNYTQIRHTGRLVTRDPQPAAFLASILVNIWPYGNTGQLADLTET